jgi:hypothetical protein
MSRYIHYGSAKFDKSKFKVIENIQFFNKPNGGLWGCEVGTKFGWKEFCELENIDWVNLSDSFEFELTPEARVLRLHNLDDYVEFRSKYAINDIGIKLALGYDFERIAKEYDVIDFKVGELYMALHGWDVDSIIVLNPDVIKID